MADLILTESDLSTITNALTGMAHLNRLTAQNCGDGAGKALGIAALKSADSYAALADKIAAAETIVVDLS